MPKIINERESLIRLVIVGNEERIPAYNALLLSFTASALST